MKKLIIVGGGFAGATIARKLESKFDTTLIDNKDYFEFTPGILRTIVEPEHVKKDFFSESGKKFSADLFFLCTGITPNSEIMQKFFSSKLNEKKQIRVNEYLQVEGIRNIFSAGDVNSVQVEKTAQNSEREAETVSGNILALENEREMRKYLSKKTPMIISLGKWDGIFELFGFSFTGLFPGLLKNIVEWKEMLKFKLHF